MEIRGAGGCEFVVSDLVVFLAHARKQTRKRAHTQKEIEKKKKKNACFPTDLVCIANVPHII